MNPSVPTIDYSASAELYPGRRTTRRRSLRYHRFDTTTEALRYVVEEMPSELLVGAILETEERRFEADQIKALHNDDAYPLPRA